MNFVLLSRLLGIEGPSADCLYPVAVAAAAVAAVVVGGCRSSSDSW